MPKKHWKRSRRDHARKQYSVPAEVRSIQDYLENLFYPPSVQTVIAFTQQIGYNHVPVYADYIHGQYVPGSMRYNP